ncbi:substrate-binding domain-containing protein [Bradyrhizobium elkanii]|nr:substrate-binding domain-containing protein [Bradyrhizobium elkanii]
MTKAVHRRAFAGIGLAAMVASAVLVAAPSQAAGPRDQLREKFDKSLKGKTVAWSPVWMGVLESEWTRVMKDRFDDYGIKLVTRDANMKSDIQLQTVSDYINDKPDVIVVQNPNVTLLAKELKRAMDAGIYVVQVNMASNTLTDAYVGVDAKDLGTKIAREVINQCGGGKGSGEVCDP